jgi:hypothetical protein
VDDAHAAPFIAEIGQVVKTLPEGSRADLSNGKRLWHADGEFWVVSPDGQNRGCYIDGYEVRAGTDWAIRALALQMARVG